MNHLHNIGAPQRSGIMNAPQAAAGNKGNSDLASFLGQIVQALQATPQGNEGLKKTETHPSAMKDLTAKIAALLKKDDVLPDSLQNMTAEELAAKIAALLQPQNTPAADGAVIKPALTSDLTTHLFHQFECVPRGLKTPLLEKIAAMLETDQGTLSADLAEVLNNIQPGSGDGEKDTATLEDILTQFQAPSAPSPPDVATAPLDPAILQKLKDQLAELLNKADISNKDIVQFKLDLFQSLKDQELEPAAAQKYMTALAKFLRQDMNSLPATDIPADQTAGLIAAVTEQPAPVVAAPVQAAGTPPDVKPFIPRSPMPPIRVDADKAPIEEVAQDLAQSTEAASAGKKDDTAARAQHSAPTPPPVSLTPAPVQSLSSKIAGCSINADMINALACADGNFNADGFGMGGNGQPQGLLSELGILKPSTADTINTQSFGSYLNSARTAPGAVAQMVSLQMQRNIQAKIDTMTLQLNPADLGRMDIKMKFEKDGKVRAHLTVDKPETLALLQKDSFHLEKVLQKSGVNIDESALSFDLRQNSQQNLEGFNGGNKNKADEFSGHLNGTSAENTLQAKIAIQTHGYITQSGVNIMV